MKVNAVVKRGVNDAGVVDMAAVFRGTGDALRFIEYMDVGRRTAGVSTMSCPPPRSSSGSTRSSRWRPSSRPTGARCAAVRYRDGAGEIGVIARSRSPSAVTAPARASPPRGSSTPACSQCGHRPACPRALGRDGRGARGGGRRRLDAPRRPLLGDPHRADLEAPAHRDVLHRRIIRRAIGAYPRCPRTSAPAILSVRDEGGAMSADLTPRISG